MSKVRSINSRAELKVRSKLKELGYKFSIYSKTLPGKPDIVLRSIHTVIFVHGCFWHRHDCKRATIPVTNTEYWKNKFKRNVERFKEVKKELKKLDWKVLVIWECQLQEDSLNKWLKRHLKPLK